MHDPATRADRLKSLLYLILAVGGVAFLFASYCLRAHGTW